MSCLPKIILLADIGQLLKDIEIWSTYDHLRIVRESTRTDANQGIVALAFAESGAVDVCSEEAHGGENSRVKCGLMKVSAQLREHTLWYRIHGRPNIGDCLVS